MGGLFSAPKPVVVQPPAPPPAPPAPDPAAVAEAARDEARQRRRQGLAATIVTSARGVMEPLPALARKSLLGE